MKSMGAQLNGCVNKSPEAWTPIPAQPLTGCVASGSSLNLSVTP